MAIGSGLRKELKKSRNAYLFIAPFYVMFLVFMLFPIAFSFVLSFQRWNGIMAAQYVGLENYRVMLSDPGFRNALINTLIFTVLTVTFSLFVGLFLALFLNRVRVFKRFYRAIFFIPAIVSLVVVSLVWKLILNSDVGLIREAFDTVSLALGRWGEFLGGMATEWRASGGVGAAGAWLVDGVVAPMEWARGLLTSRFRLLDNPNPLVPLLTITLVNVWAAIGFNTVIYLAGLQGIPPHLYETSRIDGATGFQNFRYITWPLLRPTTFFVMLMSTIDALQVFVLPNVMKRDSEATMTVVYYLYRNAFQFYQMGYASALAYVLFAMTIALGIALRVTIGRKANWVPVE